MYACACVCVRGVRVRACARACVRVCLRTCTRPLTPSRILRTAQPHTNPPTHPTDRRTHACARALACTHAQLGVRAPAVYSVDAAESTLYVEFVAGATVRAFLRDGAGGGGDAAARARVLSAVGRAVARLHDGGLVHGDLTTSNMIVREADGELVLIDFGLAANSTLAEDKAVDLYVLERAVTAAHPDQKGVFEAILAAYKAASRQWCPTLNRFADVRARGRKRAMVG